MLFNPLRRRQWRGLASHPWDYGREELVCAGEEWLSAKEMQWQAPTELSLGGFPLSVRDYLHRARLRETTKSPGIHLLNFEYSFVALFPSLLLPSPDPGPLLLWLQTKSDLWYLFRVSISHSRWPKGDIWKQETVIELPAQYNSIHSTFLARFRKIIVIGRFLGGKEKGKWCFP